MANNKFESLAYSLHFHSKSNYVSANYYEKLDQGLTYVSTLATVLGSASGGISLLANQVDSTGCARLKTFANLVSLTATMATGIMNGLDCTEHSPTKKQGCHNEATYRMKELSRIAAAWNDKALRGDRQDSGLLTKYEEFAREQRIIEEECIKSEDWTFPQVREKLSPKWKKNRRRDRKIFSLSENWEQGLCEWQNGPSVWHYFDAGQPVESNSLHFGRLIPDIFFIQGEQGG